MTRWRYPHRRRPGRPSAATVVAVAVLAALSASVLTLVVVDGDHLGPRPAPEFAAGPSRAAPPLPAPPPTTSPPTTAPPTTAPPTTAPPTTSPASAAPATSVPMTTVAPAPSPTTPTEPAVQPLPSAGGVPLPPDPGGDPLARSTAAFWAVVPSAWSDALRFRLGLHGGSTSWSRTDGLVEFGTTHAGQPWPKLLFVAAHEFGHLLAIAFGPGRYPGEPPESWVPSGRDRVERFADCVAMALTGVHIGAHGQAPCSGASLESAAALVEAGPPVAR